uniref:Uncharacterized protein n=1 Tax=Rhizophora mucronata TaxID=61149 RepID=A0A2P2QXK9_RHIMU
MLAVVFYWICNFHRRLPSRQGGWVAQAKPS